MKVLLSNNQVTMSGYTVISPEVGNNPFQLDAFVDNNECQEIICDEIIHYIDINNLHTFLRHLESKLAHGGKLIITGTDSLELARLYYYGLCDTYSYNKILFGNKSNPWEFKQSVINLKEAEEMLRSINFNILSKKIEGYTFTLVGERK